MTLVDIGNRVFDRLVDAYGENPADRLDFFHHVMAEQPWNLLGSAGSTVKVSITEISFNFEDEILNQIQAEILEQQEQIKLIEKQKIDAELKRTQPKEVNFKSGEVYNFWGNTANDTNIEIKWQ